MKKYLPFLLLTMHMGLAAQSGFSPPAFVDFVEQNAGLTASGLLEQYPAQTTYYSSRLHEPVLKEIPYYDSLYDRYCFTEGEQGLLRKNGFMVSERLSYHSWIDAFARIYTDDMPVFISTDFILFTLHQSYDEILKTIEFKVLEPGLRELIQAMYSRFPAVYDSYTGCEALKEPMTDVDLYLAVARSLLEGEEHLPQRSARDQYDLVMKAISEEQMVNIPLFTREDLPRKIDFSQFKPRGHYSDQIWTTSGEITTLENYFRSMMWLGRIDFLMTKPPSNPWEPDWSNGDILRMNLSALLLNEVLLSSGKKSILDRHESFLSFMVGPDDNLTPDELLVLTSTAVDHIADLTDTIEFAHFQDLLESSNDYGQKIMSAFFLVDPNTEDSGELPVSFRLLGQKFLLDSYILSQVVFDRITFEGVKQFRMMPDPLDVFSVLGNEDAMALMKEEMEKYKYAYKINELRYLVESYDEEFWSQSLYNTWLSSLVKLNPPSSVQGCPYFMQTVAWHHQKLNTQLTSWAQLRHDNILYGKQSYTGGTGCSFPYAYVEPYPDFYAHIRDFSIKAERFFREMLSVTHPETSNMISGYYETYAGIMEKLVEIARKELYGEVLEEEEQIFLKTMINSYMSSGPSVSGWINDLIFPAVDMWDFDFIVADVHTQPTEPEGAIVGNVLHVGNGLINLAVVIAPNTIEKQARMCYVGPVGSFHTLIKSDFYRLNDEEWKGLFFDGDMPPRPDWAYIYLADQNGDTLAPGKALKGITYNGIESVKNSRVPVSYLLVYPNPASDNARIRFMLNEAGYVEGGIYNLSGQKIQEVYMGSLQAGEHDLGLGLKTGQPGLYYLQLYINGTFFSRKILLTE